MNAKGFPQIVTISKESKDCLIARSCQQVTGMRREFSLVLVFHIGDSDPELHQFLGVRLG